MVLKTETPASGNAESPTATRQLARANRLAWLLDNSIRLPGGYRIGLDGIIGLVPGIGDAASAMLSGVIVLESYRLGAPRRLLARMLGNVGLEFLVGSIPLVGDVFDLAFKANARNVALLQEYQLQEHQLQEHQLQKNQLQQHQNVAQAADGRAEGSGASIREHDPDLENRKIGWIGKLILMLCALVAMALIALVAYAFFEFSIAIINNVFAANTITTGSSGLWNFG